MFFVLLTCAEQVAAKYARIQATPYAKELSKKPILITRHPIPSGLGEIANAIIEHDIQVRIGY